MLILCALLYDCSFVCQPRFIPIHCVVHGCPNDVLGDEFRAPALCTDNISTRAAEWQRRMALGQRMAHMRNEARSTRVVTCFANYRKFCMSWLLQAHGTRHDWLFVCTQKEKKSPRPHTFFFCIQIKIRRKVVSVRLIAAVPISLNKLYLRSTLVSDWFCVMAFAIAYALIEPIALFLKVTVASDLLCSMSKQRLPRFIELGKTLKSRQMSDTWRTKREPLVDSNNKSPPRILAPIGRILCTASDQSRHVADTRTSSTRLRWAKIDSSACLYRRLCGEYDDEDD